MSIAESPTVTVEQFLALPEDGVRRELIDGAIRERGMTTRNRWHSQTLTLVSSLLANWWRERGKAGLVPCGDVGCRLDSATVVGIDAAYFSPERLAEQTEDSTLLVGPPVLAVEILSPSDNIEAIHEKTRLYLKHGVRLVWLLDPYMRTLTVHRPDHPPRMLHAGETWQEDPELPGLVTSVIDLFE